MRSASNEKVLLWSKPCCTTNKKIMAEKIIDFKLINKILKNVITIKEQKQPLKNGKKCKTCKINFQSFKEKNLFTEYENIPPESLAVLRDTTLTGFIPVGGTSGSMWGVGCDDWTEELKGRFCPTFAWPFEPPRPSTRVGLGENVLIWWCVEPFPNENEGELVWSLGSILLSDFGIWKLVEGLWSINRTLSAMTFWEPTHALWFSAVDGLEVERNMLLPLPEPVDAGNKLLAERGGQLMSDNSSGRLEFKLSASASQNQQKQLRHLTIAKWVSIYKAPTASFP